MYPILSYTGGKEKQVRTLMPFIPVELKLHRITYHEPFCGMAAMFRYIDPDRAVLIDRNKELIVFLHQIQKDVEAVITEVERLPVGEEYFNYLVAQDPADLSLLQRAVRFYYIHCVSYLRNYTYSEHKSPAPTRDKTGLRRFAHQLQKALVIEGDFSLVLDYASAGDFVYLDPPYYKTNSGHEYLQCTWEDHLRIAEVFRELDRRGCLLLQTNSYHPDICNLYSEYNLVPFKTLRHIIINPARKPIQDLIITNYSIPAVQRKLWDDEGGNDEGTNIRHHSQSPTAATAR